MVLMLRSSQSLKQAPDKAAIIAKHLCELWYVCLYLRMHVTTYTVNTLPLLRLYSKYCQAAQQAEIIQNLCTWQPLLLIY